MGQVDGYGMLVAVEIAIEAKALIAQRDDQRLGVLDLDHLGALIGEDGRRQGTGYHPGEIEDTNPLKSTFGEHFRPFHRLDHPLSSQDR